MFTYHTRESAPAESQPLLEQSQSRMGFVPNMHRVLAEAPATYEAYQATVGLFQSKTTLSPLEQQVVMMTANYENRCHYCVAGHSAIMERSGMPAEVIEALREEKPLGDAKLEALRSFTRELIEQRGHIGDEELQRFLDAGYHRRQALEVLTGLSAKLISNFTNALAHTDLDPPMEGYAWRHPRDRTA